MVIENYRKMNLKLLLILLLLLSSMYSLGQEIGTAFILKGTLRDHATKEKLPGVNIYLKGTSIGTSTDENGRYSFMIPVGRNIIVFSYIGYKLLEKEESLGADTILNIFLEPDERVLDEIQVTSQRKFFGNIDYGREIPTISSKEIGKLSTNNASDVLHARLSGVWSTKTSGAPGDQQKIRIRGQASFFSSAEPLYVIDGVPVPIVNLASLGISDLNVNDIENVTVLKDASSTALYGFQGGNGVILIDTKKATENSINFSVKSGLQWFDNYYDLMNTEDFLSSLDYANKTIRAYIRNIYPPYSDTLANHNRQDEIFQNGFLQEYQLSASGNKTPLEYYLSGNYTHQTGILPLTLFERGTFTAKISRNFGSKMALDFSYRGSYQNNRNNQNEYNGNRLLFEGISKSPCLESIYDTLAYPTWNKRRIHADYEALNGNESVQSLIDENNVNLKIYNHAASLMGRYQFNNELSINLIESVLLRSSKYNCDSRYYLNPFTGPLNSLIFSSSENVRLLNHQINLSYNKTFGPNTLNAALTHRLYADNLWWQVDSMQSIPEHYSMKNSMVGYGTKGSATRQFNSFIANVSYDYKKLFFISAVANLSRIKEGLYIDYYTVFPSISASIDFAKLAVFSNLNWINELNFYSNIGTSGNYPLNGLANDLYMDIPYTYGGTDYSENPIVRQLSNRNLKHESTSEYDFGFKSSFIDKRLTLSGTYFVKNIGDQIIQRDIPYYFGGGKMLINLGNIKVKGFEMNAEAVPVRNKNLSLIVSGNISASSQRVTQLANGEDIKFYNSDIFFPEFIIKEGEPLGNIYGYKSYGKWSAEYKNRKSFVKVGNLALLNNDSTNNKINENDKVVIGNSVPDFNWNLSSSFQYKNLSVDFTVYAVHGVDKCNATRGGTIITGVNRDANGFYADSISAIFLDEIYESSAFIEDASFIKLKTVTISYEPTAKILGALCRFSLSLENLLTITSYKGFDPEATIFTDNNFSDNALDRGAFPNPKGVFATINFKF